jgi:hypothetical protein
MTLPDCMPYRTWLFALIAQIALSSTAAGQTYAIESDLLFYGDNTEFTNPYRAGETIFGTSGRVLLDVTWNDTVKLRGGLFGSGRYGSHEFLEHAEPAIALELSRGPSRLIFGSLDTIAWRQDVDGPDLETPHRLLPPIQRETLTFTRGQEMGLQWLVASPRVNHDAWINWQRLNSEAFRERFDAGYRADLALLPSLRLQGQWHVVHEGGQQFDHGAVSDSQAGALGLQWSTRVRQSGLTLEGYSVATQFVPDREQLRSKEAGLGVFTRAALIHGAWRTHLIVWRGRDTLKEEGDPNYLALRRDGAMFHKVRDYAELGLTRRFQPAPGVHMFAAFRMHRIESEYEYSYRIVARVHLRRAL